MIALDTNFLVSLLVSSHADHERAKTWFKSNKEELASTNINVGEFFLLLTHPRVFPRPMTLAPAIDLFETFKSDFNLFILEESENWIEELKILSTDLPSIKGNEVFDARIALALRYNNVKNICTLDSDFKKYDFLKVVGF